jgi:hypothetical protein
MKVGDDIAIALEENARITVHRADCPAVRRLAQRGAPVITMLAIQCLPPDDDGVVQHSRLAAA